MLYSSQGFIDFCAPSALWRHSLSALVVLDHLDILIKKQVVTAAFKEND